MAIELDRLAGPSGGPKGAKHADFWLDQINAVRDNAETKRWIKRGETIEKRYRDERNRVENDDGGRRYNSLWSNTEILKPALYGRTPLPIAERRFKDKDPVGRSAAQLLERALRNEIEICGYDEALQRAVSDYLLPGRGTVWVRYEPQISESVSLPPNAQLDNEDKDNERTGTETVTPKGRVRPRLLQGEQEVLPPEDKAEGEDSDDIEDPELEQQKLDDTGVRIVRESTPVDFLSWVDFMTFPARARVWKEVTAVAKRVYMTRNQAKERFGTTIGKAIPLEKDSRGHRDQGQSPDQDKCQVWEIWNKDDRTVYWVSLGYPWLLDRKDDPLSLEHFFPVPQPLYANPTNNTLVPVPDYIQYQDQAIQIDELTQRIALLTKACKVAGVYNSAAKDISRMFSESVENELIPVDDWAAFAEKGGVAGNISFVPIQDILTVLNELMVCKQKQIEEMDRLTGINDIMRGTSDARETLGGVRLKVNSTGTRLTSRQNEVARFARDTVRIMADIMSQHFSPQSLIEASGALYAEGLGPSDMPDLTALQNPTPPPQVPPMGGQMGTPRPMGQLPVPAMPGPGPAGAMGGPGTAGATPGAPPQMPPQAPPMGGTNVVPFRPPGQGMAGPPGMPPVMSGMMPSPQIDPKQIKKLEALFRIAKGIKLLRNERLRGFRVDIEVDSTIFPDAAQEKQDRMEFLTATTTFLQNALQMGAAAPETIPLLAKLLQFGTRGHRVGRDLEGAIEEFGDQAASMAARMIEQQKNQPNPEMLKAQNEQAKTQATIQAANLKAQSERESAQAEIVRQQTENEGERVNAALDAESNKMDLQMKLIDKQIEQMKLQMEVWKMEQARADATRESQLQAEDRAMELQQRDAERADDMQDHQAERKMQAQQHKDDLKFQKQSNDQKLDQQRELGKQKIAQAKATARAKPKTSGK